MCPRLRRRNALVQPQKHQCPEDRPHRQNAILQQPAQIVALSFGQAYRRLGLWHTQECQSFVLIFNSLCGEAVGRGDAGLIRHLADLLAVEECAKEMRISSANAIGTQELIPYFQGCVDRIVPILRNETVDIDVRSRLAAALGNVGDPCAIDPIKDFLLSVRVKLLDASGSTQFVGCVLDALEGLVALKQTRDPLVVESYFEMVESYMGAMGCLGSRRIEEALHRMASLEIHNPRSARKYMGPMILNLLYTHNFHVDTVYQVLLKIDPNWQSATEVKALIPDLIEIMDKGAGGAAIGRQTIRILSPPRSPNGR